MIFCLKARLLSSAGYLLVACLILTSCGESSNLTALNANDRILAFGDSLTYGTGVSKEHSYPSVLSELLGLTVVNAGVPGEISADGLKRLPGVLRAERPNLVILCHGGNDILRRMSAKRTKNNLVTMVGLIRDSGAEVVIVAVPKFGLFPRPADYYQQIADELLVPVEMDILADLESDNRKKSDQVHFNREGYREMAEAVRDLLKEQGAITSV